MKDIIYECRCDERLKAQSYTVLLLLIDKVRTKKQDLYMSVGVMKD
jgi:hypothetical protein